MLTRRDIELLRAVRRLDYDDKPKRPRRGCLNPWLIGALLQLGACICAVVSAIQFFQARGMSIK